MSDDLLLLARYLDDDLPEAERTAFEGRLEAEPALRAELELQRRIEGSLKSRFAQAPDPAQVLAAAKAAPAPAGKLLRPTFVMAFLAVAAVLIAVLPLLTRTDPVDPGPSDPVYRTGPPRPLHVHYATRIEAWKPDWVCKTEQEFKQTFAKQLGQALLLKASEEVKALGLAYVNGLSPDTIALLAEVEGQKIMVFVDKKKRDRRLKSPNDARLKLYRREVGTLVLYEVSPLSEARVLPGFEAP